MKKTLLTITLAISSMLVIAQDNAVKWNIGSLAVGTGYFSYERALSESKSVNVGLHFTSLSGSVFADAFESDDRDEGTVDLATPSLKGWGLTAEYRMYTSSAREGLSGFFFAPFLRHSQYTIGVESQFEKDNGDTFIGEQSLTLKNSLGVGFVIGTHFNVGSNFSIDVTWFGLGVSTSKIKGKVTTNDASIDFRNDAADIIADIEENEYLTDYTIEKDKVEVSSTGFMLPIIRGNIAIGYRF